MDPHAPPSSDTVPDPPCGCVPEVIETAVSDALDVLIVLEELATLCGWLQGGLPSPHDVARAAATHAGQPTGVLDTNLPMPGALAADLVGLATYLDQVRAELDILPRHDAQHSPRR